MSASAELFDIQASPVLDVAGVAKALDVSVKTFQRRRSALTRDHGFPRHLPGLSLRWSRAQVLSWIASNGAQCAPAAPSRVPDLIADAQELLHQRYGGGQ